MLRRKTIEFLTGAFYVGLLDGLLGVAVMMTLLGIMDRSLKFPAFSSSKI